MAEHARGTWYAERLRWDDGDDYWAVFAPDPDPIHPDDVVSVASRLTEGTARLMAAAPDLLEACTALLRFNEELCLPRISCSCARCRPLRPLEALREQTRRRVFVDGDGEAL